MSEPVQSDAFVLFGATGDLAYKKIFPALHSVIKRGSPGFPIIGVSRGGSSLDKLRERGAGSIRVACTHGLFSDGALQRLAAEPDIAEIVCTNTVPLPEDTKIDKLTVLSIAPALAEAIRRIHNGESVSVLFEQS